MLAINPFVSINDILRQTLEKSKQVFAETPESLKEMPNLYYNLTFGNSYMTEQEALEIANTNQITNNGRVTIINGVLESFNIQKSVAQISCPIIIVHTLQNTITTNDHIYDLCHYKGEPVKMMHSKLSNFIADPHAKRMILNLKGSYASYEEREPSIMETIKNFIKSEPDQNNLLDWIMNEKMLIHTEQDILNLQELELEEVQGYIEKLSDVRKIAKEIRDEFLIEAQNFAQNVDKKLADIELKVERSEENINTLKQASLEKIRNREITPGMLEKVRRQHEERLMVIRDHLQVIRNHDREPLNLLLIIARDLDALDNHMNAIATASNAKNLDQYYNELQSMLTKSVFDSDRIIEIINIKTGTMKVFVDAKVALNGVYRHILHVEERYKAIPSVPLFDHNIQNLKTKGTELELHIIQLRLRLISFIESIMQYLNKLNLDNDQSFGYVNEVLNIYHREITDFLDLLVIDDSKFVKINKNLEDPNYINSPGYLYTMAKMEIEGKYTKDLKISKLQEFKKRLEKASSMKKSLQNIGNS